MKFENRWRFYTYESDKTLDREAHTAANRETNMETIKRVKFRHFRTVLLFLALTFIFLCSGNSFAETGNAVHSGKHAPAARSTTVPGIKSSGAPVKSPAPPAPQVKSQTGPDSPGRPGQKKGDRELLWKMTSDSGATLYLLGTIHVFKPSDYPLPEEMEKAFAKARALIVEVDVTRQDPRFTQAFVAQRGLYSPPDNLLDHISTSSRLLLQNYCTKRNIPLVNLSRMRPWLIGLTIVQKEMEALGYVTSSGIDLHFLNEAHKLGKKVINLETMEFQLNLFASLPQDLQEMDLNLTLVELARLPSDAAEMMKAWWEGDDRGLDDVLSRDIKEHPELAPVQEKLLYERNITMAEKLEAYLKGGTDTYIVAIGSGHLVGDRSVIALLKKRGFKVSQIQVGDKIDD
jgi:uncharacterized protein